MRRSDIEGLLRQALGKIAQAEESVKKTKGLVNQRPFIKNCEFAKEDINAALILLKGVKHDGREIPNSDS